MSSFLAALKKPALIVGLVDLQLIAQQPLLALDAPLLIVGDDARLRCFMPVGFALDFLVVIDGFEKVLLVADGLRELLYIYESLPA